MFEQSELPANQLPLQSYHVNHLAQVHGPELAGQVITMHRFYLENGGINPMAVRAAFPEGSDNQMDEEMMLRMVGNFSIWNS